MKKIIFLAALLVCSIATQAQRFALVDMEYILKQIPCLLYTSPSPRDRTSTVSWARRCV